MKLEMLVRTLELKQGRTRAEHEFNVDHFYYTERNRTMNQIREKPAKEQGKKHKKI